MMSEGYRVFVNNEGTQFIVDVKFRECYILSPNRQYAEVLNHFCHPSSIDRRYDVDHIEQIRFISPPSRGNLLSVKTSSQQHNKKISQNNSNCERKEKEQVITLQKNSEQNIRQNVHRTTVLTEHNSTPRGAQQITLNDNEKINDESRVNQQAHQDNRSTVNKRELNDDDDFTKVTTNKSTKKNHANENRKLIHNMRTLEMEDSVQNRH
ncbi:unnamed protein product [Adineta steineri]|uniref:Uncharacterized protein n=1 Tax=Adineta steineri TaxID=433720 RepID=A0A815QGT3_9BILA|nr:unnamed protein product [Adineta steineri]CAF3959817.1 unnamed protein product [Adineta steineri]